MADRAKNQLDSIEVASPCGEDWDEMRGTNEARFCSHCAENVHDLSAMTRKQAKKLVAASNGDLCVRFVRRPDGQIQTADRKLHQIGRRAAQIAAGVVGATLAVASAANAQDNSRRLPTKQSSGQLMGKIAAPRASGARSVRPVDKSQTANSQKTTGQISFTILDPTTAAIRNARVVLASQKTGRSTVATTDEAGVARFERLEFGNYLIRVESPGFQPLKNRFLDVRSATEPNVVLTLEAAAEMGEVAIVSYQTPLLLAVFQNKADVVKQLIADGADVNVKDRNNGEQTALHVAVEMGSVEITRMLLDAKATVNAEDKSKQTPLLMIDVDATVELVRLLIERGANVNHQDERGETALMKAAQTDRIELVQALLEAGANVHLKDADGANVLSYAALAKIEELLKSHGASEIEQ